MADGPCSGRNFLIDPVLGPQTDCRFPPYVPVPRGVCGGGSAPAELRRHVLQDRLDDVGVVVDTELVRDREQ